MNRLVTAIVCAGVALVLGSHTRAQTPDGSTPAEEAVCDPLQADGVTVGLYGLCVAFCESQDHAAISAPITEAELALLEDQAPSGRILANYNRKRTDGDPPMPCIKVEEPCPCWTAEELAAFDGVGTDGAFFACASESNPDSGEVDVRGIFEGDPLRQAFAWNRQRTNVTTQECLYLDTQVSPVEFRFLRVSNGTLTPGEAAACLAQVVAACDTYGL